MRLCRPTETASSAKTPAQAKPHCRHHGLLYATATLSVYESHMIACIFDHPSSPRAATFLVLLALGAGLAGCADLGDKVSPAFADPAKYDYYDCKQLEAERKALAGRMAETQGLMAKADTGAAGPLVAELAYRNDYIAIRGQTKLADEAWQRNKCHDSPPAAPGAAPATAPAPPANPKGSRAPMRSGNAGY
jgi:hypothetical protein